MSENFVAEYFSLLGISLVVISLRIVSRILSLGLRRLQLDDYLMLFAGVSSSVIPRSGGYELTRNTRSVCTLLRPLLPTMSVRFGDLRTL